MDYKNHLEVCFKYISDYPGINAKCHPISGYAKSVYSKLKQFRDGANWFLSIEPPWMIPIENDRNFRNRPAWLLVGGIIEVRNSAFTRYSFALCIVTEDRIARRFHFDVDTGSSDLLKPVCHMQYGGVAYELNFYLSLIHI